MQDAASACGNHKRPEKSTGAVRGLTRMTKKAGYGSLSSTQGGNPRTSTMAWALTSIYLAIACLQPCYGEMEYESYWQISKSRVKM